MFREEKGPSPPDISGELAKTHIRTIIEDLDCVVPRRVLYITYSGPNIKQIVSKGPDILKGAMMITGTRTYIDEYYVDRTDPNNVVFHIFWHGIRGFDHRTDMWGWVRIKHGVLRPDGSGSLRIEFYGKLVTAWEKRTFLQRTPFYELLRRIYTYIWYDNRRRKFLEQCKEYQQDMVRRAKELIKLMETAVYPYP